MPNFSKKLFSAIQYLTNSTYAGIPLEIFFVLIDECNYKCKVCSLWSGIYKKTTSNLSLKEIKSLIDSSSTIDVPTFIISGGEPFLHPEIIEIIEYASSKIKNVRVNTNASLINSEIAKAIVFSSLKEIWISLDGTKEYYNKFRGVENAFERTTQGILYLKEAKEKYSKITPRILIDTIISNENISSLQELINLLGNLKIDELSLIHTCYVPPNAIKETEKFLKMENIYSGQFTTTTGSFCTNARLQKKDEILIKKYCKENNLFVFIDPILKKPPNKVRSKVKCLFPWMNMEIFPWGDVCVCPILDKIIIGNIREKPLMEIWNSSKMQEIRKFAIKGFEVCKHCICYRRTPLDHILHPQTLRRILF